jgi:hypothetical protein
MGRGRLFSMGVGRLYRPQNANQGNTEHTNSSYKSPSFGHFSHAVSPVCNWFGILPWTILPLDGHRQKNDV